VSSRPAFVPRDAQNPTLGIILKVLSAAMMTGMLALVKFLSQTVPTGEIVFARSFFGLVPILVVMIYQGELVSGLRTKRPMGHLRRAVIGCTGMFLWFGALDRMPLPDATAIGYAAPLFTVILAYFLLGETIRIYRWSAVLVGLAGVLVILSPHLGASFSPDESEAQATAALGALLAFGAAFFMALAITFVRKMTDTEQTSAIVVYFSAFTAAVSLISLPFGWVMPTLLEAVILLLVGLIGGTGQILITQAYRYADTSTVAPFEYTTMIWAITIGWIFFDEVPTLVMLIGTAIVVGAGLFVIYREQRLGVERRRNGAPRTPTSL
jgi:drug/metabolite transporter (DMT)-like permease